MGLVSATYLRTTILQAALSSDWARLHVHTLLNIFALARTRTGEHTDQVGEQSGGFRIAGCWLHSNDSIYFDEWHCCCEDCCIFRGSLYFS